MNPGSSTCVSTNAPASPTPRSGNAPSSSWSKANRQNRSTGSPTAKPDRCASRLEREYNKKARAGWSRRLLCQTHRASRRANSTMKLTFQQPDTREIKVRLLLAGGQSATLVVAPEHPLLVQLLATVAAADGAATGDRPSLFQIPMEGGRASLAFAAHQLVGVITDPAVVMHGDAPVPEEVTVPVASAAVAAAAAASAAQGHGNLVRHPVAQLDGFLSGSEVAWLMELALAAENRFIPARVSDDKDDYRHSFMLAAPDALKQLLVAKITAVMPEVMPRLRLGQFALG